VAVEWPAYGCRRVTAQLLRQGWVLNRKRLRGLMRKMGLQAQAKHKKRKTTDTKHNCPHYRNLVQDLQMVRADQVWVWDITYIRLRIEFVYLAVIMDVFTRCIGGWHLGRSLDPPLTLLAPQEALAYHQAPGIRHSDQGVHYAGTAYTQMLREAKMQISMPEIGEAWQNGHAERLLRTIKEEEVDLSHYEDYNDAPRQLGQFPWPGQARRGLPRGLFNKRHPNVSNFRGAVHRPSAAILRSTPCTSGGPVGWGASSAPSASMPHRRCPSSTPSAESERLSMNTLNTDSSGTTARVQKLRERLLDTTPQVCVERARLVTEAYQAHEADPPVLRRAKALAHVLDHMTVFIAPGELIVGNQASSPRAVPIFPEYSIHWIGEEIDHFANRPADVFLIRREVKKELLEEILPYWRGRTLYDRVMATLPDYVKQAQEIGAISGRGNITSGDGHIIVDFQKVLSRGLEGVIEEAEKALGAVSFYHASALRKRPFLEAAIIACRAAVRFAARYAEEAERQANKKKGAKGREADPVRRAELERIAQACRRVPAKPPRTFHEVVQSAWFVHLITQIESNGHSFSLGRFDQYTYPFYQADIEAGRLTEEKALEILQCLWLKLFSVVKIRPWAHTRFGIGYPTYQNVTVGGQTREGQDATNELSYMVLHTIRETRLTQPNVSARYHSRTPERFLMECARTIRLGFGMPAMKNDEIIIPALLEKGVRPEDACDYAIVGCVEAAVPGKWGYRNTGMAFLNLLKVLELAYNDGRDPSTGVVLHPGRGDLADLRSFDELYRAFREQLNFYTRCHVVMDTVGDLALEELVPDGFCSALVADCIVRGKTIKEGGAIYDVVSGLESGVANVANALMALKKLVYEEGALTAGEVKRALETDFGGTEGERVRQRLLSAPKYGNDVDEVDELAARVLRDYLAEASKYRTTRYGRGPIGGTYAGSTSNISANVPLGQPVCATPDGRRAGEPIAEGVSPFHGTDVKGPTAVMRSVTKLPTIKMIAQLLNLRLSPGVLEREEGLRRLVQLLRGFQALKGWHLQFNIVSTETLMEAQKHPEKYRDLVVRVAGYSALFVTLDKASQDDIIARTVHQL